MSTKNKIVLVFFGLIWLALGVMMLSKRGITLYNLLVVAISGCIVFIPLWKKFTRHDS